jgi:hypothetical protein
MADDALHHALAIVAEAMRPARDPWWLIGSAAMTLHGASVSVADIDLMVSVGDADRLFGDCVEAGQASERFRSARHGSWQAGSMAVDVMAELDVRRAAHWHPVRPATRVPVRLGAHLLFTPDVQELLAMCRLFDRPKDRERAALLSAIVTLR